MLMQKHRNTNNWIQPIVRIDVEEFDQRRPWGCASFTWNSIAHIGRAESDRSGKAIFDNALVDAAPIAIRKKHLFMSSL
jgi:hypothetical protein